MHGMTLRDRLYQAFLHGYQDSAAAACVPGVDQSAGAAAIPSSWIIENATHEGRELRRSIDACESALAQLDELPQAQKDQLQKDLRATLQYLLEGSTQVLDQLKSLRPNASGQESVTPVPGSATGLEQTPKPASKRPTPRPPRKR